MDVLLTDVATGAPMPTCVVNYPSSQPQEGGEQQQQQQQLERSPLSRTGEGCNLVVSVLFAGGLVPVSSFRLFFAHLSRSNNEDAGAGGKQQQQQQQLGFLQGRCAVAVVRCLENGQVLHTRRKTQEEQEAEEAAHDAEEELLLDDDGNVLPMEGQEENSSAFDILSFLQDSAREQQQQDRSNSNTFFSTGDIVACFLPIQLVSGPPFDSCPTGTLAARVVVPFHLCFKISHRALFLGSAPQQSTAAPPINHLLMLLTSDANNNNSGGRNTSNNANNATNTTTSEQQRQQQQQQQAAWPGLHHFLPSLAAGLWHTVMYHRLLIGQFALNRSCSFSPSSNPIAAAATACTHTILFTHPTQNGAFVGAQLAKKLLGASILCICRNSAEARLLHECGILGSEIITLQSSHPLYRLLSAPPPDPSATASGGQQHQQQHQQQRNAVAAAVVHAFVAEWTGGAGFDAIVLSAENPADNGWALYGSQFGPLALSVGGRIGVAGEASSSSSASFSFASDSCQEQQRAMETYALKSATISFAGPSIALEGAYAKQGTLSSMVAQCISLLLPSYQYQQQQQQQEAERDELNRNHHHHHRRSTARAVLRCVAPPLIVVPISATVSVAAPTQAWHCYDNGQDEQEKDEGQETNEPQNRRRAAQKAARLVLEQMDPSVVASFVSASMEATQQHQQHPQRFAPAQRQQQSSATATASSSSSGAVGGCSTVHGLSVVDATALFAGCLDDEHM